MTIKHLAIVTISFLAINISAIGQNNSPIQTFSATKGFEHALLGICVKDAAGNILHSLNAKQLLTPASTMKVITTASALEILGGNFRYRTHLEIARGDTATLIVRGVGDPTLGSEYAPNEIKNFLPTWVEAVRKLNVKKPLRIVVDDSAFGYEGIPAQWTWQNLGNYYAPGSYGISLYDNTFRMYFNTQRTDTLPVITRTVPHIPELQFHNYLTFNTSGVDNVYIYGMPLDNERRLYGNIPSGKTSFSVRGNIPDPAMLLASELAKYLRRDGINVVHYTTSRLVKTIPGGARFYTHSSPTLTNIIRQINERSNNHYAECLLRTIATQGKHNTSALRDGLKSVSHLWKDKQLNTKQLTMYDGSGLSPMNAVTPEYLVDVLLAMNKGNNANTFLLSLPLAGKEGTVSEMLKNSRLVGRIRMKSGSISGVQCYTGYYQHAGETYAFSVMVNRFTGTRSEARKAIEKLLLSIF